MGILLAAATALLFGLNALPARSLRSSGWSEFHVAWANTAVGLVPLALAAAFWGGGAIREGFWASLAFGVAGNMFAFTLYYRALGLGELSIVLPLVSISPLFMLVTSRIMVGEHVTVGGASGVLLVVAGAWFLGAARDRADLLAPLRALWRDRAARIALLVAFLWSITSNLDKRCVAASDSFTYPAVFSAVTTLAYAPFAWWGSRSAVYARSGGRERGQAALLGLLHSTMLLCQMSALGFLPVPYVIAVKRAGLLVGVAADTWRGLPGTRWRLAGALLILAGIVILLVAG